MKLLLFAVFLTVVQAARPVPRKAPDNANGAPQGVTKDANDNKAPAVYPSSAVQPVAANPDQNASSAPKSQDGKQAVRISELPSVSIRRDWIDGIGIFLSGVLVFVGCLGVRAAYRTLRAIESQVEQMRTQGSVMNGQLTTMRGQLDAMKIQNTHLEASVKASQESVKSSERSISTLINKERPQISVPVHLISAFRLFVDEDETDEGIRGISYRIDCYCPSTAFIEDAWAKLFIIVDGEEIPPRWVYTHPPIKEFARINTSGEHERGVSCARFHEEILAKIHEGKAFVHFSGQIKYKGPHLAQDEEPYITKFHYRWASEQPSELQWWEEEGGKAENYRT
jgi:hypothetical protein